MPRALATVLAALLLVAGCGGSDTGTLAAQRHGDLLHLTGGEGPARVTVIRPADADGPLPLVLFLHGWGATEPRAYGPWLEHLARAGNAVIYPRYQDSVAEPPPQVLGNAIVGIRTALAGIEADTDSLVVAGHSAGGALAADYAAVAPRLGLPRAGAVLSMYPGRGFRGSRFRIPPAGPVPEGVRLVVLIGADDRVVDPRDARAIHDRAHTRDRTLETIRTPAASHHLGPQRPHRIARSVFWSRLDALIADARAG